MLRLEVLDFAGPLAWRWRLTDADTGKFLADHEVRLDQGQSQFEAFADLDGFLRWSAAPDRRLESEAELVDDVGAWIGERVLGPVGEALVEHAPVTVVIDVPPEAEVVAYRPLELGWVNGRPLALQEVSFVLAPPPEKQRRKRSVGKRLRILGVFSLPVDASALNLRRERVALARLVSEIATSSGRAVELRVLQYGVTRKRLREVMLEGDGWDVLHISGHGLPAGVLLEKEDGSHDPVSSPELVKLLEPAASQVKLVLMSSCESAALTAAEHLRLLGITPSVPALHAGGENAEAGQNGEHGEPGALPAVAVALAGRLDCAVVAMRYPVVDDFAIALAARLYELMLAQGNRLPRALGVALTETVREPPTVDAPAISVATPALFGARAADLALEPPDGPPVVFDLENQKLAEFPPQPKRFVGRVGTMTRATAVLAPRSGRTGILLHGMAGAGKTACALELAYTHEQSFARLVWHEAPPEGDDVAPALSRLALDFERQLPGVQMAHVIDDVSDLEAYLPKLASFLRRQRVLIVIDNCESLLSEAGGWRDQRWQLLIDALSGAGEPGFSRLIMTSRRQPDVIPQGMLVEPVHALPVGEAVLLARELEHLRPLVDGTAAGLSQSEARELAARTLTTAQGHPKLIELADGQAADPATLRARLADADLAWGEVGLDTGLFLQQGESLAGDADYLQVLDRWTRGASAGLPAASRVLFEFLCCVEPDDRFGPTIMHNWGDLWRRLDQHGDPPSLEVVGGPLSERALVHVERDAAGEPVGYHLHPAIAASGRATATAEFRTAVEEEIAKYWVANLGHALDREGEELGWLVLRAGRGALPYLVRLRAFNEVVVAADSVLQRDRSPSTAASLLPLLSEAATRGEGTADELALRRSAANALEILRPAEAIDRYTELLDSADKQGQFVMAAIVAVDLIRNLRHAGRLRDALALVARAKEYARRAGLGPWTQLAIEGQRLQLLAGLGRYIEVLDGVEALRLRMADLPYESEQPETANPFNVRETILDTGFNAASETGQWELALALSNEELELIRRRGAPPSEVAWTAFNNYGPLLSLDRVDEARDLLLACRQIFEQEGQVAALGRAVGALASVENLLGHRDEAIRLASDALRLAYAVGRPWDIRIGHENMGVYLGVDGEDSRESMAHLLAAAIISYQTETRLDVFARNVGQALRGSETLDVPSWEAVCDLVGRREGVRLAELVAGLPRRAADGPTALAEVVRQARAAHDFAVHRTAAWWEPVLSAMLAAQYGEDEAAAVLDQALTARAKQPDWTALCGVLRRIAAGERSSDVLVGLDPVDTAIAERAMDALNSEVVVDPDAWRTLGAPADCDEPSVEQGIAEVATAVVAAVRGDEQAAEALMPVLADMAKDADWARLAQVLERILAGESAPGLVEGLDPMGTAVVQVILEQLSEQPDSPSPSETS